jgi:CRISPR-associated endonuclease Cas2
MNQSKQMVLIAYDMSDDKKRVKIADKLVAMGLDRVQKSVFIGLAREKKIAAFIWWFQKEVLPLSLDKDKLLILPLSIGRVESMSLYGNHNVDKAYLTGKLNTLII